MEEENFLSKALRIIGDELPKFFTETNTPFLGKDEERSVMKAKSSGQQEKEIVEGLLTAGAMAPMAGKAVGALVKTAAKNPTLTSAITALGMQDPTALLSGPIGLADAVSSLTGGGGSIKDAEATIVPANLVKDSGIIANALNMLKKGLDPKDVYKQTGVYEGPLDKKTRAVISDKNAVFTPPEKQSEFTKLEEIFKHPELFDRFPSLKNILAKPLTDDQIKQGYKAMYLPATAKESAEIRYNPTQDSKEITSAILHELQHGIQKGSDFVGGSSPNLAMKHPLFEVLVEEGRKNLSMFDIKEFDEAPDKAAKDIYKRTGGEVEARAVQEMKKLGDAGARSAYTAFPLDFYDVAVKDLLQAVK